MTAIKPKSQAYKDNPEKWKDALLEAALIYANRGWPVFPLQPGEKIPFPGTNGYKDATIDHAIIQQWWIEEYPGANIGIACGDESGLIVLDIDGPEAEALLKSLKLPVTLEATTGREGGRHLYLASNGRQIKRQIRPFGKDIPLDILGTGGYVVAPPSYRLDEDTYYEWTTNGDTPIAPFPAKTIRRQIANLRQEPAEQPGRVNGRDPQNKLIPKTISEGTRNDRLTSAAGSMRRRGLTAEEMVPSLLAVNERRCDPPLPEKEVQQIAQSIEKERPDNVDDAIAELNEKYAVVKVGGKIRIMEKKQADGGVVFLTKDDFMLWLSDRFVDVPNKERPQTPLGRAWLSDERHHKYNAIVFKPGITNVPKSEFNLWRDWPLTSSETGSCERFQRHLRGVVCRGNEAHYEWFMDWLADIIQHPMRKVGLAVALKGSQGAGKSIVGAVMKKLLGQYQTVVEKPEHVVGRFNGHLAYCLLLQAEEAFWAGNRTAEGVLKHLVTGDHLMIDRKGIDSVEMPNYTRLLITSNSEWIWPTSMDDRRLVIFEVSGRYRRNQRYFEKLAREMFERGGCARLLHELLTRKIDHKRLRTPPRTKALEEQAAHSMSTEEAWVYERLEHGMLPGQCVVDDAGHGHLLMAAMHAAYEAKVPRGKHVMNPTAFGKFLSHHLPKAKGIKYAGRYRFIDKEGRRMQSRVRVIAPLKACRDRYSDRGRAAPQNWPPCPGWQVEK